jgi:hypothetical protein
MKCSNQILPTDQPTAPPPQICQARMKRTANNLVQILEEYLPKESLICVEGHRPDLERYLSEAKAALLQAADGGDKQFFTEAVRNCASMFLQVSWVCEKDGQKAQGLTYSSSF